MFDCRIKKNIFPKEGEIVIGKVSSITDESIMLKLLEYNNIQALIMNTESSIKKLKSLVQMSKVGTIEYCTVSSVDTNKSFIDLSLKRPFPSEINSCKDDFNKNKLAYQIMTKVSKLIGISVTNLYEEWGYKKMEQYDDLYAFFAKAKENLELFDGEKYGDVFKTVILKNFKGSPHKVRVDVDVSCATGGLVELKKAFLMAIENNDDLEITLLKSPIYSIVCVSESKEDAFDAVNNASEIVKKQIESVGGTFSITVPAKLYGEKSKLSQLEEDEAHQNSGDDESD